LFSQTLKIKKVVKLSKTLALSGLQLKSSDIHQRNVVILCIHLLLNSCLKLTLEQQDHITIYVCTFHYTLACWNVACMFMTLNVKVTNIKKNN